MPSRSSIIVCLLILSSQASAEIDGGNSPSKSNNSFCQLYHSCRERAFNEQRKCDNHSMESIVRNRGKIFTEIVNNYSSNSMAVVAMVRNCVRSAIYNAIIVADEGDPVIGQRDFMNKCLLESPPASIKLSQQCRRLNETLDSYHQATIAIETAGDKNRTMDPKGECRKRVEQLMIHCSNFRSCCPAAKRCENRWQVPAQLPQPLNEQSIAVTARNCIDLAIKKASADYAGSSIGNGTLRSSVETTENAEVFNFTTKKSTASPATSTRPHQKSSLPFAKLSLLKGAKPTTKQEKTLSPGQSPPATFFAAKHDPVVAESLDEKKPEKGSDSHNETPEEKAGGTIEFAKKIIQVKQMPAVLKNETTSPVTSTSPPAKAISTSSHVPFPVLPTLAPLFPTLPTLPPPPGSSVLPTLPPPSPIDYRRLVDMFRLGLQYYQTTTQWMRAFTLPVNIS